MPTKRKQQADSTKMRIFAAVSSLLETKSDDAITIREICTKAGVSIGSFYHYFESKDDILVLFYDQMDNMARNISRAVYSLDVSALNRLILYFVLHAQHVSGGRLRPAQLLMELQLRNPSLQLFSLERLPYKNAHKLIQECIQEGSLVGVEDPDVLCDLLQAILRGLWFDWGIRSDPYDLRQRMFYDLETALYKYAADGMLPTEETIREQTSSLIQSGVPI